MKLLILILTISITVANAGITGKEAPEFGDLKWYDGNDKLMTKTPKVKELRGKFIILKFWQSWCPGCLSRGLPTLYKFQEHFKDNGKVKIFAIQTVFEGFKTNSKSKIKQIRKRFKLTIPMAHDDGASHKKKRSVIMDRYRSGGTPWFVIINQGGKVVFDGFHLDFNKTVKYIEQSLKSNFLDEKDKK